MSASVIEGRHGMKVSDVPERIIEAYDAYIDHMIIVGIDVVNLGETNARYDLFKVLCDDNDLNYRDVELILTYNDGYDM